MQSANNRRDNDPTMLSVKINPNPDCVRKSIVEIARWLEDHNVAQSDIGDVEIVLAEALNNIVEHSGMKTPETINLVVEPLSDHILCRMQDSGIPSRNLIQFRQANPLYSAEAMDLPEGGFGISLIQAIATNIEYLPVKQGNLVRFSVPLTTNPVQI